MKNRAFTLLELIVTVVIVGILATVAIPFYQNTVESSKDQVCQTNLQALKKAVEIYTMEHDTVPGSLSELRPETINKAYASVMSAKGSWKKKLAYLIVEGPQWGWAYAMVSEPYGLPNLRCPSNPDPNTSSYGLNGALSGITALQYKNLPDTVVIIADSGSILFNYSAEGAGGGAYTGDPKAPWIQPGYVSVIIEKRGHKKYNVLSGANSYLKGVDKSGRIGRFAFMWQVDPN